MKSINSYINEKLTINQNTKQVKDNYFTKDNIEDYISAINDKISYYGYVAYNKNNYSIWVFKKDIQERQRNLKNLICAIESKTYIEWGPNDKLKSILEESIFDAIKSVD